MNTTQQIEQKRKELAALVEKRAKYMVRRNFKDLQKTIEDFSNDPYMKGSYRTFDKCGDFTSELNLGAHEYLALESELKNEVENILTKDASVTIFERDGDLILSTCLGDAVTINFSDRRHCYAIHSQELKLKVNYSDLVGDDDQEKMNHALFLVEKAMRKAGYFPNIVELDYYGNVSAELTTGLGDLSDEELEKHGQQFEESEEK